MIFFLFMGAASAASTNKKVSLNDKKFTTVNIPFVENQGQISDKTVKYSANTFIGSVYVKDNGIVYALTKDKKGWVVSEKFVNSNIVNVKGYDKSKTKVSYYKGKSVQKKLTTYSQVKYSNLYNGIDLYLKAHGKNIEKIYSIGSSGSPSSIWVTVSGSKGLKINKNGELVILNGLSALKLTKPVAYQIINGKKVNVSVSYVIRNLSYGYKTGAYNKNYKLIIDPLLSSTFLGGTSYDNAQDVAVDKQGNVYVTGYTGSFDFPTKVGQQFNWDQSTTEWDAFVSKFDSTLSTLISSTYIGGSFSDKATGIALDNSGNTGCNVFITGTTYSSYNTALFKPFPTTTGAFTVPWESGAGDVFISKLSNDLGTLESSTFYGGNRSDISNGIIIDASNNVYITGQTFSYNGTDGKNNGVTSFPAMYSSFNEPLAQNSYVGTGDVFVSKLDNNLAFLRSGVVFGGSGTSYGSALAVDQSNNIYVTGATNATDFPAVTNTNVYPDNGFQTNKGDYDAFVIKLSAQYLENIEGLALLGGSARDEGNGIAVDSLGRVYIVGGTWSNNMFTTNGARQRQNNGKEDAFLTILDKQIQNVLSSTYLGGNGIDVANDVIVADPGTIGIIGTTNSTNFYNNLVTGDITPHGMEDVFFSAFTNPMSAQERVETTLLGGANADYGQGIAISEVLGEAGNVYLVGDTWSNDYPTSIDANQSTAPDMDQYVDDAFVSKLDNIFDVQAPIEGPSDPANNSVNVPLNKVIKIVFNEKIRANNLGLITLQHGGINTPITVSIVGNTLNTLNIIPAQLLGDTTYILSIPVNAIQDYNGNLADNFKLTFNTTPGPLSITGTNPLNNANIVWNQPITITFNQNIKTGSKYSLISLTGPGGNISITKLINGKVLTITPPANLPQGTYTLNLPANSIFGQSNTGIITDTTLTFIVTPPTVTSTDPVNTAVNVPTNKLITVTFDRAIKMGSASLIDLKNSSGTAVPITFSITNNVLSIYHTTLVLTKNTTYTLTLNPNCITDLAGNGLATQLITKFKTAATTTSATSQTANAAPKITSINPANNSVNVATNKVIKINFSEAIKLGKTAVIELKTLSGKTVKFKTTISGKTLSITPTTALAKGTVYVITIHANSVTDSEGKGLATTSTTKFKTVV
jgi:methionine-rich copper-binding protein CopC